MVFVFGSNLAGRHGAGAAAYARQDYEALYGQGEGLQGSSYAIPTKNKKLQTLTLPEIKKYVDNFITFAENNPEIQFVVTPIGCGLAGYNAEQIAPMFRLVPTNCYLSPVLFGALI